MSYEGYGPSERDNWKPSHKKAPRGIVFKFCRDHHKVEPVSSPCFAERQSGQGPAIHAFRPFYHEHLGPEPVLIESKSMYRRICAQRGVPCPL